jgi:hypothetical protein
LRAIGDNAASDSIAAVAKILDRMPARCFLRQSLINKVSMVMAAIIATVAIREPAATHVMMLITVAMVQ